MALVLLLVLGQFGASLLPESPATEADAALQEQVEQLLQRQIDINRASAAELLAIPWLNPILAYRMVALRDSVGHLKSVEELRHVPGMSGEAFAAIRPFLRLGGSRQAWTASAVSKTTTDSPEADWRRFSLLNRAEFRSEGFRVSALTEKDTGETNASDFLSAGAEFRNSRLQVALGDVTAASGQGLVFSAPHWRSSLLDVADRSGRSVRLVSSPVEASYLRGGALEAGARNWNLCVLGSFAGRDARLNEDGSVERLVGSGVHDDSISLAGSNAVHEAAAGLIARYRGAGAGLGIAANYSHYSRTFAPSDSSCSFAGDELLAVGVNADCKLGNYALGVEAASSGVGAAGALELHGDWQDFESRLALRGRQARFFSPHGRWSSLAGTRDRLDASGRLGWHHAGSSASLSANTYRDFDLDSVPARIGVRLGQELGRLTLALALEVRYRAEEERCRTAKAEIGGRLGRTTDARLTLADAYPEKSTSRGTLVAVWLGHGLGPADLGIAAARIAVAGAGVSMYLHEPGAGRIGTSYRSSVSCWRLSAGGAVRIARWLRLGLKTGCAWKPGPTLDGAAQLEVHR